MLNNPLFKLKKKQKITYLHDGQSSASYPPHTGEHKLKVLYGAKLLGSEYVVKCSVVSKGWYHGEVYITEKDFLQGRIVLCTTKNNLR